MSQSIMRYKADYRTLAFVAIYFILAIGGFIAYEYLSWTVIIPLVVLTSLFSFFCAVIVHNTVHSPIFRKKSWNRGFQNILSLAYGYSVSAFVPGHNFSHHKETQTDKDTMRTTRARFRWNFLNQFMFFFLVTKEIMVFEQMWVKKMYKEKPAWFRQWLIETIIVNIFKIGLTVINWQAALLFIWGPHLYGVWGIVGTNVWQHDGCDPDHPYNHTRSFTSPLLNYFAFNNGYHGVHHEKPGLHWSLLPEYHKKHIEPNLHPNLNRNSLLKYLWEANIWPGIRVDYLGNRLAQPPKSKTQNWIEGIDVKNKKHQEDFGAEVLS